MTPRDIIENALTKIGVLASGESASASMISKGLASLNDLCDSWSLDGLLLYENQRISLQLPGPQSVYTIGPSGDLDTERPLYIAAAAIEVQGDLPFEIPLKILENEIQWSRVTTKELTSTLPTKIYIENSFPLARVYLWPIPTDINKLILYSPKQISNFANASTQIFLPKGYARALKSNMYVEIASDYGAPVDLEAKEIAINSKADIQRANWKPSFMCSDVAGLINGKSFNILTGE